jgi:hypothetical protein
MLVESAAPRSPLPQKQGEGEMDSREGIAYLGCPWGRGHLRRRRRLRRRAAPTTALSPSSPSLLGFLWSQAVEGSTSTVRFGLLLYRSGLRNGTEGEAASLIKTVEILWITTIYRKANYLVSIEPYSDPWIFFLENTWGLILYGNSIFGCKFTYAEFIQHQQNSRSSLELLLSEQLYETNWSPNTLFRVL